MVVGLAIGGDASPAVQVSLMYRHRSPRTFTLLALTLMWRNELRKGRLLRQEVMRMSVTIHVA